MSYRSGHRSDHHHPHDHGRAPPRRPAQHAAAAVLDRHGYAIVHAGKQVRFGPVVFWIVVGTIVLLGMWSAATATYFAFRDDVLTRLIARQAEMQYAYEDRIAELRTKVDRTTSRQLLDQEQFDQKLDQIMRRQTALESRATALGAIPDAAATGSLRPPARGAAADTPSSGTPKPSPISDTVIFVAPPDREARLELRAPAAVKAQPNQFAKVQGFDNVLVRLQTSLDSVERRQMAALERGRGQHGIARTPDARRVHRSRARHGASRSGNAALRHGRPVRAGEAFRRCRRVRTPALPDQHHPYPDAASQRDADAGALSQACYRRGRVYLRLRRPQRSLPRPPRHAHRPRLPRRDRRSRPRHRERQSLSSGWMGGYGRMVEIDHGNGLATRYGHLSEIHVKVGDVIKIGQVIGAVGSTGRSTGPHLHYETRIDGDAVDPQKFLRAGVRLSSG